jgi:hypothetical protein
MMGASHHSLPTFCTCTAFDVLKDENTTAEHIDRFFDELHKNFRADFFQIFLCKNQFSQTRNTPPHKISDSVFSSAITSPPNFFISREVEVLKIRIGIICTAQKMSPINFRLSLKKTGARFRSFKKIAQL